MRLTKLYMLSLVLLWAVIISSCDAINPAEDENLLDYSCEGCHSSGAMLAGVIDELGLEPVDDGHEAPG